MKGRIVYIILAVGENAKFHVFTNYNRFDRVLFRYFRRFPDSKAEYTQTQTKGGDGPKGKGRSEEWRNRLAGYGFGCGASCNGIRGQG